jgi:hypothetical protein
MNCAAVIIEGRRLGFSATLDIITRHTKYLEDFDVIGYCSNENHMEMFSAGAEIITILPELSGKFDFRRYNQLLTSEWFWFGLADYDRVLIFQHDSGLLRDGIEEFLEYDYVGAPWGFQEHGGNGGLSIRNPEAMLKVIRKVPYFESVHGNEDVYFCNAMKELGMNLAPRDVCARFAIESILEYGTLGYHAIDKYFSKEIVSKIKSQYA